jgi:O-antigen/teichoic acid export membrane protein
MPPIDMSLKQKTLAGVVWVSLGNSANQVLALLVFIVLARRLDANDFGHVMLAVLFINIFTIFFKVGVVEYLVQLQTWEDTAASTAFWIMAAVGVALTLLLAVLVGPALQSYWGGDISAYIGVMSTVVLLGCLSVVNQALVRRHFRFRVSATRNLGNGLVAGLVAMAMALAGYGAWSLVVSRVIGALGGAIILWVQEPYRPTLAFSAAQTREITRYVMPVLSMRFLSYFSLKMPDLLLSALVGPAALAIYRVGGRIIDALNALFLESLANVLVSTFARVGNHGADRAFRRIMAVLSAVVVPVFVGCAVVAPQLTVVFYGSKWQESSWVMLLLSLQIAPLLLRSVTAVVYTSLGKAGRLWSLGLIELSTSVLLTVAAAMLGPVAVAASMLISIHLAAALFLRFGRRDLDFRVGSLLAAMRPFVFSAFAMGACVFVVNSFATVSLSPLAQLVTGVGLGMVLYPLILLLFFPSGVKEFLREATPLVPNCLAPLRRLMEKLQDK